MKTIESTRRFIQTWCRSRGIGVQSDNKVTTPAAYYNEDTGQRFVVLPAITTVNHDEWQRLAYHESSHLTETNLWHYQLMERYDHQQQPVHRMIANCLVDNLAERDDYHQYRGRAKVMSQARMAILAENKDKFLSTKLDRERKLIAAALTADSLNRQKWMVDFMSPIQPIDLDPEGAELFKGIDKLKLEQMLDYLEHNQDVDTAADLVDRIVQLIQEPPPPPQEQQPEPQPDGKPAEQGNEESPDEGQGQGQSKSEEGEGRNQGESEGEEGQGQGQEESKGEEQGAEESQAAAPAQPEEPGPESTEEGTGQAHAIFSEGIEAVSPDLTRAIEKKASSEEAAREISYRICGRKNYYVPHGPPKVLRIKNQSKYDIDYTQQKDILDQASRCSLSRQIRKYLQLKSHGREVHGVVRGRLSGKSLHRLYTTSHDTQPRVFRKKEHGITKLDSAVALLVDCSGSMAGVRRDVAAASALALSEVLAGLRVRHEIAGFSEVRMSITQIYLWREYEETVVPKDQLSARMSDHKIDTSYNTDGEAVQWMAERLYHRKEQNKVMIVLSDGKPAGHYKGDGAWYLNQVTKEIEEHSPIHLIGIGIMSRYVEHFYKNHRVINSIEQLPEAVLETLRERLIS